MAVNWNESQKKVIESRDKNLLVSAAAGSGKTAVLVERILSLITDPVQPVDLERLLVLTFTNAAAGEMKERIGTVITRALEQDPDNDRLQRQASMVHSAHISTIHSFCSYVIRNYFHTTDLDPSYRVMDDGEKRILMKDTLKELLDEAYAQGDEKYVRLSLAYSAGKNDKTLSDMIEKLYTKAESAPWPEEWLAECAEKWNPENENVFSWMEEGFEEIRDSLAYAKQLAQENLRKAALPGGPSAYIPALEKDVELIDSLLKAESMESLKSAFTGLSFETLSRKKDESLPELKDQAKNARNKFKNEVNKISGRCMKFDRAKAKRQMEVCYPYIQTLCQLTSEFRRRYSKKKREDNLCDFSDLEHFALDILVKKAEGIPVKTPAALELSAYFKEVMCDEYQDTNRIQELILWSVSREEGEKPNRFMVGDVKQSIYGFRMARPDIFVGKYEKYGKNGSSSEVISLSSNYRSRREVLDFANAVFKRLMIKSLGGIDYDESQALVCGASYPAQEPDAYVPEILLFDENEELLAESNDKNIRMECEALMVSTRIHTLLKEMKVYDKSAGEMRRLQYRDIVILLRTAAGWAETFVRVLQSQGIPAFAESKTGYFSAAEVALVLEYLRILDNPRQDISLASVLLSPIAEMSAEELALVKVYAGIGCLYDAVRLYATDKPGETAGRKLNAFLNTYDSLRAVAVQIPVHILLGRIYRETGYYDFASAMPGGEQRKANLDMLVSKAVAFEKTSMKGLFSFIRYIGELKEYDVDAGEVNLFSEGADTVRILSVHKAKGLEFPVVFLSGTGKEFNQMDVKSAMTVDEDLGIGIKAVNLEKRIKAETILKQQISDGILRKSISEEIRILYVALTRAKEKTIITGYCKNPFKKAEDTAGMYLPARGPLPAWYLLSSKTYLDFIFGALYGHPVINNLLTGENRFSSGENDCDIRLRIVRVGELAYRELENRERRLRFLEAIRNPDTGLQHDGRTSDILFQSDAFHYIFAEESAIPEKVSVSELKKHAYSYEPEEDGSDVFPEEIPTPYIPKFASEQTGTVSGSFKGTAYHEVMRFLDYNRIPDGITEMSEAKEEAIRQMMHMKEKNLISEEQYSSVDPVQVAAFLISDAGRRMKAADSRGQLKREQPFMMLLPADSLGSGWHSEEGVIVQGIIDACFIEDGAYVILDYKTDRLKTGDCQELVDKYALQLYYYEQAVKKNTGLPVKEKLIYSTAAGRCIKID